MHTIYFAVSVLPTQSPVSFSNSAWRAMYYCQFSGEETRSWKVRDVFTVAGGPRGSVPGLILNLSNCPFCLLKSLACYLLSLKGNQFLQGIFKMISFPSSASTGCSRMLLQSQEYCREGAQGVSLLCTVLNKQFWMNLMGYMWLGFKAVWASTVCSHHA